MEQFSYDLSLALEETSRITSRSGRWTARRRTRSTGNLPCAPQPTEDSSSSEDGQINYHHHHHQQQQQHGIDSPCNRIAREALPGTTNTTTTTTTTTMLSDSDNGTATSAKATSRLPLTSIRADAAALGNFESDSLNETFSPARPCARRKRKFKRMAVEYDTTTTTATATATPAIATTGGHRIGLPATTPSTSDVFSMEGRTRVGSVGAGGGGSYGGAMNRTIMPRYGGSCQDNFRANLFFCGKRKRSHRDRYDYDHHRTPTQTALHSSSVPRQRDSFSVATASCSSANAATRASYLEHLNRSRGGGGKIQPLNKNIISRIERIAQDSSQPRGGVAEQMRPVQLLLLRPECEFQPIDPQRRNAEEQEEEGEDEEGDHLEEEEEETMVAGHFMNNNNIISIPGAVSGNNHHHHQHHPNHNNNNKAGSLESNFSFQEYGGSCSGNSGLAENNKPSSSKRHHTRRHHRHKRSAMGMQLQFEDPAFMDCPMADILSSSSLSSSDSETDKTCDSDREGDDELTDWPGNEGTAVALAASGELSKRTKSQKGQSLKLPLIRSDDTQDEDTRMSADEMGVSLRMQPVVLPLKPGFVAAAGGGGVPEGGVVASSFPIALDRGTPSMPIDMPTMGLLGGGNGGGGGGGGGIGGGAAGNAGSNSCISAGIGPQIESEMSGETSNHFLSSPNAMNEVREFRAGCRRVREERPSFSVITSVNEDLSRFLQDGRQRQLQLPDTDALEHEKLAHLAKLYSLHMRVDRGVAVLTKTSNTTQPVRVDRSNISNRYLSDFKRRCYEEAGGEMGPAAAMTTEEQEMHDIQS